MMLNARELATVLAALRLWQSVPDVPFELEAIADDAGDRLTKDEIDDLCERLNVEAA